MKLHPPTSTSTSTHARPSTVQTHQAQVAVPLRLPDDIIATLRHDDALHQRRVELPEHPQRVQRPRVRAGGVRGDGVPEEGHRRPERGLYFPLVPLPVPGARARGMALVFAPRVHPALDSPQAHVAEVREPRGVGRQEGHLVCLVLGGLI